MKLTKKNGTILLGGLSALCLAMAFSFAPKAVAASAETTGEVVSVHNTIVGASIRVDDKAAEGDKLTSTGIRFGYALDIEEGKITFDEKTGAPSNIQTLGMKISIGGVEKDIPFYAEGKEVEEDGIARKINRGEMVGNKFEVKSSGSTVLCLVYLYNFQDVDDYVLDITASGYATIGEASMTSEAKTKSIAYVARAAHDAEDNTIDETLLENFFVVKAADEMKLFDATKGTGEKTLAEVFPDVDLSAATVSATSVEETPVTTGLTYADGAITGVPVNGKEVVKQVITFTAADGKLDYQVTVNPYTNVIGTWDELKAVFPKVEDTSVTVTYDGYYILSNDIACGGNGIADKATRYSLTGTFDGNGYKIDAIKSVQYGIFGCINGVIKNVAFTNVKCNPKNGNRSPVGVLRNTSTLENVYIGYAEGTYDNSSSKFMVFGRDGYASTIVMNNVVIDISKVTLSNQWNVKIFAEYWTDPFTFDSTSSTVSLSTAWTKNGGTEETVNENVQNVYVISQAPLMYQKIGSDAAARLYILDGANRESDETLAYIPEADNAKPYGVAYFAGVQRYDSINADYLAAVANAVESGTFSSNYWKVDEDNGLVWAK